jgi:hypothetical protein
MNVRFATGALGIDQAGEVFYKATDGVVIPNLRVSFWYPFLAPGWTDLRVGFLLSVTDDTADDTITGLGESISASTDPEDRYWIGVKNGDTNDFPRDTGTVFIGFTNASHVDGAVETSTTSNLSTSDIGVGTTNANYWRPNNGVSANESAMIIDGTNFLTGSANGLQQHFPQNVAGAGGYCVLLGMRLQRASGTAKRVTAAIKSTASSADMLFSSAPTLQLLIDSMKVWPTGTQTLDSVSDLSEVPTSLYCYWPFANSRLRIHAVGILRNA